MTGATLNNVTCGRGYVMNAMKRIKKATLAVLSATLIGQIFIPAVSVEAQSGRPLNQLHVVIDPGHGGRDPGTSATHNGVRVTEAEVVLDVSLRTRALLNQTGINVHMTRTTDVYRTLNERAQFANSRNADLFVSVHLNGFSDPAVNGTETYYIGSHGRAAFAAEDLEFIDDLLESGEYDEQDLDLIIETYGIEVVDADYFGHVEEDHDEDDHENAEHHGMNPYLDIVPASGNTRVQNSRLLAQSVQARKLERLGLRDRGVRTANFAVLRETNMAAVLSEIGFLTNAGDRNVMLTEQGRQRSAEALYLGILDYLVARGYNVPSRYFNVGGNNNVPNPPPGQRVGVGVVTADPLSMRSGPSSDYSRITRLPRGTRTEVLGTSGSWTRVRASGHTGWVRSRDLARQGRGVTTTANLNMRRGPGTNHGVIRQLPNNTTLRVMEQNNNSWARVRVGSEEGWIHTDHLRINLMPTGTRLLASSTTFRQGPGSSHNSLGSLRSGTVVDVRSGQRGNWARVRHNGQTGYVRARTLGSSSTFPSNGRRGVTTTSNLNMRRGPGTNHGVIRQWSSGTRFTILETSGGWMRVQNGGYTGWVSSQHVATEGRGEARSNTTLRRGPSSSYGTIRQVPSGSQFTVLEQQRGWARIHVGSDTGWIRTRDLRIRRVLTGNQTTRASATFRRGPSSSYGTIRTIARGQTVNVRARSGNWVRVTHNGQSGYIRARTIRH